MYPEGKILGIDYGSKRIGIALSDETKTIAFGKTVLLNQPDLCNSLLNIIQSEKVEKIVIGYPVNLKGQKTAQTIEVEKFEQELKNFLMKEKLDIDVFRWDERLTSKMAQDSLLVSGMKKKKRRDKSNLDIIAAALLLQSYLDANKSN